MKVEQILNQIYQDIKNGNQLDLEEEYFLFHQDRYRYILNILERITEKKENKKLLDIGVSPYHLTMCTSMLKYNVFGLNMVIENLLEVRFKKYNINIVKCDLIKEPFPFENNFFDFILFSETLEHFNFHPDKTFNEIYRVLQPMGQLIITTPNLLRLNNRVKMLIGKSINWDIKDDFTPMVHWREYSASEVIYLLEQAGFKVKTVNYANFDYPNINKWIKIINRIISFFIPALAGNLIIIAEKP